jgi:uroporphyrin-III C-methyltransferase/precorrin-2 dehydrogenase/sirohydrochlorin ferrochelatase
VSPTYPLTLDVRDRRVVVVGGGPVAARRARGLVEAGAEVVVVAPWTCEDLADLVAAGRIRWLPRE